MDTPESTPSAAPAEGAAPDPKAAPPAEPGATSSSSDSSPSSPGETPPAAPSSSAAAATPPADPLPELVRVAKAERKAAAAIKDAEQKTARLTELEAKEAKVGQLIAEGKFLDAAFLYFPNDAAARDKLYWQMQDWAAKAEDDKPAEPTVDEKIAKALAEQKAKDEAAAKEKADADAKAKAEADAKAQSEAKASYFGGLRKALAENLGAYPTVSKALVAGDLTQDEVYGHVEAIAQEVLVAAGVTQQQIDANTVPADVLARVREATAQPAILAALEQVLGGDKPAEQPTTEGTNGHAPPAQPVNLDAITAEAIASAEKRRPPTTVSSAAVQGAAPVAQKKPESMTLAELDNYAIAEALRKNGAPAAR